MSRALAVFHGRFGRATVYQLNRPFNVHAHREGHLIFQVGGTPGHIRVGDETLRSRRRRGRRRQSLGAAQFPADRRRRRRAVLRPLRQRGMVRAERGGGRGLSFGRSRIARTPAIARHVDRRAAAHGLRRTVARAGSTANCGSLIAACHEESWPQAGRRAGALGAASPIFASASRSG